MSPAGKYRMVIGVFVKGPAVGAEEVRFAIERGRGRVESVSESGGSDGLRELTYAVRLDEARQAEGVLNAIENIRGIVALRFSEPRRIRELRRA